MKDLTSSFFVTVVGIMKDVLDIGEFVFDDKKFKYFKKEVMNVVYRHLETFYRDLEQQGVVERCECSANLRRGWTDCETCHGCGYKIKLKE